jgi:hypothetical protein
MARNEEKAMSMLNRWLRVQVLLHKKISIPAQKCPERIFELCTDKATMRPPQISISKHPALFTARK